MNDVSLKPVDVKQWPDDLKDLMARSITSNGDTIDLFKVMANNPKLFITLAQGFAGNLELLDREIIVLRTLLRCQNHYEKYYHKRMFLRAGGSAEVLEAVLDPGLGTLSGKFRALAQAVDETIDYRRIGPETLAKLSEWFDGSLVMEILHCIATYSFLTTLINTAEIHLEANGDQITDELMAQALTK